MMHKNKALKIYLIIVLVIVKAFAFANTSLDSLERLVNLSKGKDKVLHIYNLTRLSHDMGKHDLALKYSKEALQIAIQQKNVSWQADFYNEFGIYYESKMVFDSTIKYYLKAMSLFQSIQNKRGEAMMLCNIGNIYLKMNNYKLVPSYLYEGLKIRKELGDKEEIANSENNLATYFYNINKLDSALFYFQSTLKYFLTTNDKSQIANIKNNIGSIYNEMAKYDDAIMYYTQSMTLYQELGNEFDVTMSLANMGNVYNMNGNPKIGSDYCLKALSKARHMNAKDLIAPIYVFLIEAYTKLGDNKNVIKYQAELINYKDTVYDFQTNQNIAEMQTRFDTDKKVAENKLLKQENDLQSLSIKQQKIINYSVIGGLILVLALAFYIYKGFKQKQKANFMLEEKNALIEEKNKIVEEKQKEIIDSINYAKRIQYTLLAHEDFLKSYLSPSIEGIGQGYFVLFNPKDIVSGDFYWATKQHNCFYLAVCDSTGHGVPGAFMSLLNIGYLSEAINEKNIKLPNEVFNYVRKRLVDTISKEGQKDGFDGVLLCIDLTTKKITYAAANNKPVLIRDNQLQDMPYDRMPVGIGEKLEGYNLFTIDSQPEDSLYLYTDGYADQFGGPKGKKFKYKSLNDLIISSHHKSMQEQQITLQKHFEEWRGNLEQVDDVCVIGIKF